MVNNKGVILLTILVGNNLTSFARPYYSRHTQENHGLSENAQKALVAGVVVGGLLWWQKGRMLHGVRYLRKRCYTSDREFCYQCEQEVPSMMGDCGYGLCRNCFIDYCRLPACYTQDCTEAYCDGCMIAHSQSWAQWYFDWKRCHCPTCYSTVRQVEEKNL